MTALRRVSLRRARDQRDIEFVVQWLSDGSRAAAMTSDVRENATEASVREALDGGLGLRLVQLEGAEPCGLVTWRQRGNPRAYELAVLIADPELWTTGIGGEAVIRAVDYLFFTMDAERVGVVTGAFNPYTSPALVKGGFTHEGTLRRFYYVDGEYHDGLYWSVLRDEHRALIQKAEGTPLEYQPLIPKKDKERAAAYLARLQLGREAVDRG